MDRQVLKALIVDDEPIARRVLKEGLEAFSDIEVAGEAAVFPVSLALRRQAGPSLFDL